MKGGYHIGKFTNAQISRAAENGVTQSLLHSRVAAGWDVELAITTRTNAKSVSDLVTSWFGNGLNQLLCPVPNCGHVSSVITKAHCRIVHDMEREEVKALYGMPTKLRVNHVTEKLNSGGK